MDYQIKKGDLLDSWLFFLASRFRSESDEPCEIIEGDEVKATLGAFLLVGCPNIYVQAEAIWQTLRKGACPHFEGGSESPPSTNIDQVPCGER